MKCPHCLVNYHSKPPSTNLIIDNEWQWMASREICPSCGKAIIWLDKYSKQTNILQQRLPAYPKVASRSPVPKEVPNEFGEDYKEACLVLSDSPKASAALSRRCLQHILREKAGVRPQNLSSEIDEVLPKLPSHLAEAVDAIRNFGNFAAHPLKSTNSGEILDVEPGEAEWSLEVLEQLFDFYFVQPASLKAKRAALNKKLTEAGEKPMK
jgi:hypothetical protein